MPNTPFPGENLDVPPHKTRTDLLELGPLRERDSSYCFRMTGIDFSHEDLSYMDLSDCSFDSCFFLETNLTGAILNGCSFLCSPMVRACLDHTSLERTTFFNADLTSASFIQSNGFGLDLSFATLNRAIFSGATLSQSVFHNTNCSNAILANAVFDGSSFQGALLAGSDLTLSSFRRCNMKNTCLVNADIRRVQWKGSQLAGADIRGIPYEHWGGEGRSCTSFFPFEYNVRFFASVGKPDPHIAATLVLVPSYLINLFSPMFAFELVSNIHRTHLLWWSDTPVDTEQMVAIHQTKMLESISESRSTLQMGIQSYQEDLHQHIEQCLFCQSIAERTQVLL